MIKPLEILETLKYKKEELEFLKIIAPRLHRFLADFRENVDLPYQNMLEQLSLLDKILKKESEKMDKELTNWENHGKLSFVEKSLVYLTGNSLTDSMVNQIDLLLKQNNMFTNFTQSILSYLKEHGMLTNELDKISSTVLVQLKEKPSASEIREEIKKEVHKPEFDEIVTIKAQEEKRIKPEIEKEYSLPKTKKEHGTFDLGFLQSLKNLSIEEIKKELDKAGIFQYHPAELKYLDFIPFRKKTDYGKGLIRFIGNGDIEKIKLENEYIKKVYSEIKEETPESFTGRMIWLAKQNVALWHKRLRAELAVYNTLGNKEKVDLLPKITKLRNYKKDVKLRMLEEMLNVQKRN